MGWWQAFIALFGFGKATAEAVTARTKPVEIQIAEAERKDVRLDGNERERLLNELFHELKAKTELDIGLYVSFKFPDMETTERDELKMLVMARVIQFRKDMVKMRGIKWKKYREWLEKNNL